MGTWAEIKFRSAAPKVQPLAEVTGRQFQWVMRYPGPDGKLHTARRPASRSTTCTSSRTSTALIYLKSSDVLHSFFLPQMRIKQDAVPGPDDPRLVRRRHGRASTSWSAPSFAAGATTRCAGNVTVHDTQAEFDEWMSQALAEQNRSQLAVATAPQGR